MRKPSRAPVGQPTRGKTALNRLRQVDVYILLAWAHVLRQGSPFIVDVGYGAHPWTALEMFDRWQQIAPTLRLVGIEIDPQRVAAAQPFTQPPAIDFCLGGFNVTAVVGAAQAAVVRAYNVLRQYDEAAVQPALALMGEALAPGGLLIEGTSTPAGGFVVFDLYQKTPAGLVHRELVFGTNFKAPADPEAFQAVLPKRLIHHARDPLPNGFFDSWRRAITLAQAAGIRHRRRQWTAVGQRLRDQFGYPVDVHPRILRRGYLVLRTTLEPPVTPGAAE